MEKKVYIVKADTIHKGKLYKAGDKVKEGELPKMFVEEKPAKSKNK